VQGAFQDITEWKRAEEFLRRSEEKYRQITENMSDVVWTADLGMNTTYVSPSVRKLLGETPEEHLVRGMRDKFPPEDLAKLMSVLEEELERERSGDAPKDRSRIVEVQHYRADGSLVWISMNLSFIRDEKGNPIGFQGVTRDITERRLVEAEYATLFHEMLDAFALHEIICDTDGKPVDYRFISVNPAFERMTGLRLNDVKGRTVLDILPDTESYWIEKYGHVALTGEPVFFENYATLFGKNFEVKAFSHVPGQFATIFTDITERKDAEEKLRRALERTILVLTQTVERRDPYTAGHQRRVSNLAATIAREMGPGHRQGGTDQDIRVRPRSWKDISAGRDPEQTRSTFRTGDGHHQRSTLLMGGIFSWMSRAGGTWQRSSTSITSAWTVRATPGAQRRRDKPGGKDTCRRRCG
jgi:PAS domain S-box-containing protein